MGGHYGRKTVGDEAPVGGQVRGEVGKSPTVDREREVRVRHDRPVAREVLGGRRHAGFPHPVRPRAGELRDRVGVGVESALPDHLAHLEIEVDAGGEGHVHPMRPQLRRHQPAERARQSHTGARLQVELVTDAARGGQEREAAAKALHAATFLVDRNDERWRAYGVNCAHQGRQLLRIEVVACEQDHTADERMAEQVALLRRDLRPGEIDHQGTETHATDAAAPRPSPAVSSASDST